MTDIVITYVNGLDPEWQQAYSASVGGTVNVKRFRDWGTLPYLLRGIRKHMPFVGNVFLVVASDSQVPQWVSRAALKIVRHSDIIPKDYLPTFNSATIELFLHRIPGLAEQFIYFNDDCFPLRDCTEQDFFPGGRPVCHMARHLLVSNLYKKHTRNSCLAAADAAGVRRPLLFIRPQHSCTPMLKSASRAAFEAAEPAILPGITPLRAATNVNQYFFTDWAYFKKMTARGRISNRHFSLASASAARICRFIAHPSRTFACINDVNMPEAAFEQTKKQLLKAFDAHFSSKSEFEI